MRSWIIFFETAISIIILTAAYFILTNYIRNEKFIIDNIFSFNIEKFRSFSEYCYTDKVYIIYNLSTNTYTVCINGTIGSLENLSNYTFYKKYMFSGYKSYDPFILILYK